MTKNKIINISLSAVSLTISIIFIGFGIAMTLDNPPFWIRSSGYLTVLYGLASAVLLFLAWRQAKINKEKITKYLAASYLILFFLASLDVGMISPLECAGIVIVALLLWFHWFTVRRVSNERKDAQQNFQADQC